MRFLSHLKRLQRLARQKIKRQFDTLTLCHYYVNTVYNSVSWRKPYCLRNEELFPFLTKDQAAARMQVLYRMRKARHRMLEQLFIQFEKIFDRRTRRFYYAFIGKSKLIPNACWEPPMLLNIRGFYGTIRIVFTPDVAAIIIQRKFRIYLAKCFLKELCRVSYTRQWDPVKGDFMYVHNDTYEAIDHLPLVLHGDHWDPNEVPNWSVHEVTVFIRRLGYKCYVKSFNRFRIDGRTILLLDDMDFPTIGVEDIIHIRKIQVELNRIYPVWKRKEIAALHLIRRDKLKRQRELDDAAITLQKHYRGHLGRIDFRLKKEVNRVLAEERKRTFNTEMDKVWWLEKMNVNMKNEVLNRNKVIAPKPRNGHSSDVPLKTEKKWKENAFYVRRDDSEKPDYELPPLKVFGRKRSHFTCKGWGTLASNDTWVPIEVTVPVQGEHLNAKVSQTIRYSDAHITSRYTNSLRVTGYDRRRMEIRKALQAIGGTKKVNLKQNTESLDDSISNVFTRA